MEDGELGERKRKEEKNASKRGDDRGIYTATAVTAGSEHH